MLNQKGFSPILLVLVVAGLSVILTVIFYMHPWDRSDSRSEKVNELLPKQDTERSTAQSVPPSTNPTLVSSSEPVKQTVGTFSNSKYKYSIDYPTNVVVNQESSEMVTIGSPDGVPYDKQYILVIDVTDNDQNLSERQYLDKMVSDTKKDCSPPGCGYADTTEKSMQPYEKGQVKGLMYNFGQAAAMHVLQSKNGKYYRFTISGEDGNPPQNWQEILDSYLLTVKYF